MRGRISSNVKTRLREKIRSGQLPGGSYLPTERKLAEEHGIAPLTARRILKALEAEGMVVAEPRKGYRVMARANDPDFGAPLAYVLSPHPGPALWDDLHKEIASCLQTTAAEHDWSLLAVGTEGRSSVTVMEQLRAARAFGAILDTFDEELIAAVAHAGMPMLMIDEWREDMSVDAVVQDAFLGGLLAGRYLAERGCRRIAWMGPLKVGHHQALERYGGSCAGLGAYGIGFTPDLIIRLPNAEAPEGVGAAREMLARSDRPDGVVALWEACVTSLVEAARELGLTPGKDFEMVGLCPDSTYDSFYSPKFPDGPVPPAVTWKVESLAHTAVARLAERRLDPTLPPIKLKVPMRMRVHGDPG